jgi:outer membrane biosynthesis protein TonB
MTLVMILGGILMTVQVPKLVSAGNSGPQKVRISLEKVILPTVALPIPEPKEIPRLEPNTILAAPEDRPSVPRATDVAVAPEPTVEVEEPVVPRRRVYGVRKVYARGLGAGGQGSPGLVTKKGNTLDGVADTLTATTADLQGELAALSSIERAPEPVHRVKPIYSASMLKAKARGEVTAYLLVDIDGSVRDVKVTKDIGFDSREVAEAALRGFRFKPAMKDDSPVAVWIFHRIRFEFQE